ncbi:hypothetical protein HO173_010249 [Letharia columbiana]|uniref:Amidohydrolase-related domain-containing protein n=1 Tax=Letharia columbiana TaxID=112416 RepID=A0A8H6L104_9LECA|nr:uncharacterized protein HO173_010249 [Letharia columbiana]KAF6231497.1 hypothetical protein HO173_010249 [Letharia columbiana]
MATTPVVDIHTHIYPTTYLTLLRSRTKVPYLLDLPDKMAPPRLIILPSDDDPALPAHQRGRPIDSSYSSINQKLDFMKTHGITTSVISLANPWLDFLSPEEGPQWAAKVNNELEDICSTSQNSLYAFATLPLSASSSRITGEIHRLQSLAHMRGIILGTTGLSQGLDDPALEPVWSALESAKLLIFLHPHYGLPSSVYGPRASEYGHVLPLSLGFPMETTIAFTRMWLSGVFDRHPKLKVLIAHAGGTVPFLSGRINSCVQHERHFPENEGGGRGPKRGLKEVLRENVWLDAVVYSPTGVRAAVEVVGKDRVLFGTDHPFFPPLDEGKEEWMSVETNIQAVKDAFGEDKQGATKVLGGNAIELLGLDVAGDG